MSRRSGGLRGCASGVLAFALTLTLAVGVIAAGLQLLTEDVLGSGRCVAEVGDLRASLNADQAENAALLAGVAARRDLPARATTIAIATALQESKLRNIDYGDRDSVGLFQQRPSQGWGTVAEIMDPVYSTNAFYDVLITVADYEALQVTDAAQRVQRSAFPDAYAQHETRARAFASALSGHSPAALTCDLDPVAEEPTAATGLATTVVPRLERDLGVGAQVVPGGALQVDATALPGGTDDPARLSWAVAHWALATASRTGVGVVVVDGQAWTRAGPDSTWLPVPEADLPAAAVTAADDLPTGAVLLL